MTSPRNSIIINPMDKKGLILEGGALRGLFTMGILDTFLEEWITFDGAVGVSAGVAFGCNFKSEQKGRAIRYNKKYNKEWRFKGWRSLIATGDLYGAKFCYDTLPNELDKFDYDTFEKNKMDFWAVVSNCETGKAEYHKLTDGRGEDMQWIRASASMPLASRPVVINGSRYLDGGLSDSIPLEFMEKQGFTKNVVILTQPKGFVKHAYKKALSVPLRKMPNLVELVKNRHIMYNAEVAYVRAREDSGDALILQPKEALNIKPLERDPDEMQRVYDHGVEVARANLNRVKEFLTS